MNRLRKNKKGKDIVEDVDAVPSPVSMSNPFKKNKKEEPEPKPEFDLANALPSADQFRTSLLMPKLSARFSMLREQDDPTTKVGKANDDSVLFPKRASRLNLFGHNPSLLSDIDEVSINSRPSLALGRTDSYASDGTEDDGSYTGSIMNRKRPIGEGNNLFGGRQKVYKVPANASSSEGLRGRALYEDDVTLSAFQRLRLKEKEEKLAEEAAADSPQDSTSPDLEESSPAFSTKRTTSSSTTSGHSNRRTSTAATSIDEQSITGSQQAPSTLGTSNTPTSPNKPSWPPPNHVAKTRRLYGQGIAQAVQEQQTSAFSRLESISRQRAGAGTPEAPRLNRSFSKSTTNLQERPSRLSPVQAAPVYQGNNPPLSANSPKSNEDAAASTNGTAGSNNNPGYGSVPPLSPPISETEEAATLAAAVHPDDRGKATAMGLFNKPSTPFDEQQFSRRQVQMHEGRNTPPLRRRSPTNSVVQPDSVTRPRGLSNTSYRSKAESASSRYSSEAHHASPNSRASSVRELSPIRATHNSFMMNLSGSDSEGDAEDDGPAKQVPSASSQAPDGIHPAFRSHPGSRESDSQPSAREVQDIPEVRYSDLSDLKAIAGNQVADGLPSPIPEEASDEKAPDSPTLGPSGLGLSGLIRTHLRHDSSVSSIYPPPSPGLPSQPDQQRLGPPSQESHPPASSCSNGYGDSMDKKPGAAEERSDPASPPATQSAAASSFSMRAKQLRDQAAALREQNESRAGSRAEDHGPSWQDELKHMHKRDGSTETQKEREEFASVLAERRRRVEENMRNLGAIESRSSSPVPGRQTPDLNHGKPGNAFAMLKNRSIKHTATGKQDPKQESAQPKGFKMFGLGSNSTSMNASTPSLVSSDSWREEEPAHALGKHSNSSAPQIASGRGTSRVRSSRDETRESSSSRGPSPNSFGSRRRDRSNSASGRSKSRTRPRDDLGMVAEDAVSQYEGHQPEDQHGPRGPPSVPASARPSVEYNDRTSYERSASAASERYRSNSRAAAPGYIDLDFIGESPRPSPVAPYAANTTPPLPETDTEPSRLSPSSTTLASLAQRGPGSNGLPKRTVVKSQISEPTFVSSTSNVPTVGLPAGASLSNGMEAPPIPPMNPRRRQTTTQTILNALKGDKSSAPPAKDNAEERSTFEDDDDRRFLSRQRLRKTSGDHQRSEGGMF